MARVTNLVCSACRRQYSTADARWQCACGGYLQLVSGSMFSVASLPPQKAGLWRYREALGINAGADIVTMGEGWTPLIEAEPEGRKIHFKLDFLCPTGSYKDRGSTVMLTKLREWGLRHIVEDSSGNAGASVAAYAAVAGISCDVYVPASTPAGKLAQISMYGAKLVQVPGSREDTTLAAESAAKSSFYASHNWNAWFVAGMKTVAYEIAEQSAWRSPDWIVLPVGGGSLLVGVYLGFQDLVRAGIVDRLPRIVAVQAAACAPVHRAWSTGRDDVPSIAKHDTAAEGISVAKPVRGTDVLRAIRGCRGLVETVDEESLWDSVASLGKCGLYVEPTSAAAPAAATSLVSRGVIGPDESVVVVLTGSGLKATEKIVNQFPITVPRRP